MMRQWLVGVMLLILAACAAPSDDMMPGARTGTAAEEAVVGGEPEAMAAEPVMAEPAVIVDCVPGDDDGIGGTGCQLD